MKLMSLNEELIFVSKPLNLFGCGICDDDFRVRNDLRQHIEIIHVKDRINSTKRMLYQKEQDLSEQRIVLLTKLFKLKEVKIKASQSCRCKGR